MVANFIELEPPKRKEYICRLLNLDIFDQLFKKARFQTNSLRQTISVYKKDMNGLDYNILTDKNRKLEEEKHDCMKKKEKLKEEIDELSKDIMDIKLNLSKYQLDNIRDIKRNSKKLKNLLVDRENIKIRIDEYNDSIKDYEKKISILEDKEEWINRETIIENHNIFIKENEEKVKKLRDDKDELLMKMVNIREIDDISLLKEDYDRTKKKIDNIEINMKDNKEGIVVIKNESKIKKGYDRLVKTQDEIDETLDELDEIEEDLEKSIKGRDKLKDHKYNPECEVCMNNEITKEMMYFIDNIRDLEDDKKDQEEYLRKVKKEGEKGYYI